VKEPAYRPPVVLAAIRRVTVTLVAGHGGTRLTATAATTLVSADRGSDPADDTEGEN